MPADRARLPKAGREMLKRAVAVPEGNPWYGIGLRSRGGRWVMFDRMKRAGWFDSANCITQAGRAALAEDGGGEP